MSYSCYGYNREVKTNIYDDGRAMTLGEIVDLLSVFDRLSPATRKLLIERPEAIEKAVNAVEAEVDCVNELDGEMRMRYRAIARASILDAVHAMTGVRP